MKRKKLMKRTGVLTGMSLLVWSLAGCAETPETTAVRTKGADAIENYNEAEVSETEVSATFSSSSPYL